MHNGLLFFFVVSNQTEAFLLLAKSSKLENSCFPIPFPLRFWFTAINSKIYWLLSVNVCFLFLSCSADWRTVVIPQVVNTEYVYFNKSNIDGLYDVCVTIETPTISSPKNAPFMCWLLSISIFNVALNQWFTLYGKLPHFSDSLKIVDLNWEIWKSQDLVRLKSSIF